MSTYSPDEYMDVLLARQAAYTAEHPPAPGREWVRPLLDWFTRDDDQIEGVTVNVPAPAPRPVVVKRDRRSEYRARLERNRDRLAVVEHQLDQLTGAGGDTAAVNLSPFARSKTAAAAGRRRMAQLDRDVERTARLLDCKAALEHRIALDEARLTRAEEAHCG